MGIETKQMKDNKFKKYKIYDNSELQSFIARLEDKYPVKVELEKYQNLVNFSQNFAEPYHNWFKYREGFAGKLIEELIKKSGAKKGELILDPFCGSGTTVVVAMMGGYDGLGIDINPMSALVTKVKAQSFSQGKIDKIYTTLQRFSESNIEPDMDSFESVKKFFSFHNFKSLLKIRHFIGTIKDNEIKDFFMVAFLAIIEEVSNRRRDGNGLKTVESKIHDVFSCFDSKMKQMLKDVDSAKKPSAVKGFGIDGSAKEISNALSSINYSNEVGAIIFSPPYANSFDYFESYKMELVLGGFVSDIRSLNTIRKRAVRSFIGGEIQPTYEKFIDLVAEEIEKAIPVKENLTGRKDSRTRKVPNMIKGYFYDMSKTLEECSACLNSGKKCYIVVDQSSYLGKIVPTDLFLAYIGEAKGFKVKNIIVCRPSKTSGQQISKYPYLKEMLRESIVELEKV